MSSTLIIGIGTSGLEIIEQAQQFHYEFTGKNRPGNNVEYIYLETNRSRNPKNTALGETNIIPVKVPLSNSIATLHKMENETSIDSNWIPRKGDINPEDPGAGGKPSCGRLSIWDTNNLSLLNQTLRSAHQRLKERDVKILIVGTLTGGTGSGLCVDIAYLANSIIANGSSEKTSAIFLLPDSQSFKTDTGLFENTYSALTALKKYERLEKYKTRFTDGSDVIGNNSPYSIVQYLSPQFNDGRPPLTKSDLARVAGILTSLHIMDTNLPEEGSKKHFTSLLQERRTDSVGNDYIKKSITSGFTMIQYPKSQLEELLAVKLAKELLSSAIDSRYYIDKNGNKREIKVEEVNLRKNTREQLEIILKRGYEHLDGIKVANGGLIIESYKSDVLSIIKKNHSFKTNSSFIYNQFRTQVSGNYFDLFSSNKSTIRDKWIDEIFDHISYITNEKRNVRVTELVIDELIEYISVVTKYYKDTYKLSGNDNEWDRLVQAFINQHELDKNKNQLLLITNETTLYLFEQISELLKIHIGIGILEQIKDELLNDNTKLKSINGKELPTKSKARIIVSFLENIIEGNGDVDSYTLKQRENELDAVLSANNSCFKLLFANGSKSSDIEFAYNNYIKMLENRLTIPQLFNTSDIWAYLTNSDSKVYTTCVKNSVEFVKTNKFTGETDLFKIIKGLSGSSEYRAIKDLFNKEVDLIKTEDVPPMIPIDKSKFTFSDYPGANLIFISKSHTLINNELLVNQKYKLDPGIGGSNAVDISTLDNTIIIYQEYGYMGPMQGKKVHFDPLIHLSYNEIAKEHLRLVADESFKRKKVPYLTLEEFKSYIQ
jgi:hypothetical protein